MTNSGSKTITLSAIDVDLYDNTVVGSWGAKPLATTGKTSLIPYETWTKTLPPNTSWANFGVCVNKGATNLNFTALR